MRYLLTYLKKNRIASSTALLCTIVDLIVNRNHFPFGGTQIISILESLLPHIDNNDVAKTSNVMLTITKIFMNVPFRNVSHIYDEPGTLSDEDEICKDLTSLFEPWIIQFMERIFYLV